MRNRLIRTSARRVLNSPLYTEEICLKKETPGKRNDFGEYEEGRVQSFDLRASIEPIDPESQSKLRDIFPEGNRIVDARFFYICTDDEDLVKALRTGDNIQTRRDVIVYNDLEYLIKRIADYSVHGHIEVIATREEGQNG